MVSKNKHDSQGSQSGDSGVLAISDFETQFVPQDGDEEVMWEVEEITAEKGRQYKVKWVGIDEKTGKPWPQSWVDKHDCTDDLVLEWKIKVAEKKEKAKNKRKGAASSSKSNSLPTSKATSRASGSKSPSKARPSRSSTTGTSRLSREVKRDDSPKAASRSRQKRRASPTPDPSGTETDYEIMPESRKSKRRKVEVEIPSRTGKKPARIFEKHEEEESQSLYHPPPQKRLTFAKEKVIDISDSDGEDKKEVERRRAQVQDEERQAGDRFDPRSRSRASPTAKRTVNGKGKERGPSLEDSGEEKVAPTVSSDEDEPKPPQKKKRKIVSVSLKTPSRKAAASTERSSRTRSRSASHRSKLTPLTESHHEFTPAESIDFEPESQDHDVDMMMDTRIDSPPPRPADPRDISDSIVPETQLDDMDGLEDPHIDDNPPLAPKAATAKKHTPPPKKRLGPIPQVSPSKLKVHALEDDPPASTIDEFSPRKRRHRQDESMDEEGEGEEDDEDGNEDGGDRGGDEDEIEESSTGQMSQHVRQRGSELAEQFRQQQRSTKPGLEPGQKLSLSAILSRPKQQPLQPTQKSTIAGVPRTNDTVSPSRKSVDRAAANLQAVLEEGSQEAEAERQDDLSLQEMEDQYLNLSGDADGGDPSNVLPPSSSPRVQTRSQEDSYIPPTAPEAYSYRSPVKPPSRSPGRQQYDAALKLCNEKSEEIVSLTRRLAALETDLGAERDGKMILQEHIDRIELQLEQAQTQLAHAQSLATVVPAATLNGPTPDERALWAEKEGEWAGKEETWSAERGRLEAKLGTEGRDREAAERQAEIFREQYFRASDFVTETRKANAVLETAAEQAEGRAREGVVQIRALYEARLKKAESDARASKHLMTILAQRDERTGGNEVRRRAAMAGELELEVKKLTRQKSELEEMLEEMQDELEGERTRADDAVARVAALERQREREQEREKEAAGKTSGGNGRSWFGMFGGGNGSGPRQERHAETRDVCVQADPPPDSSENEEGGSSDSSEEDAEGELDDPPFHLDIPSKVYTCEWAVGPSFEQCGAVFESRKGLEEHVVKVGHIAA